MNKINDDIHFYRIDLCKWRYNKPYICPVCEGRGLLPTGFYNVMPSTNTSSIVYTEECKSCVGRGLVWSKPTGEDKKNNS